ncbi:TonB-dependent receptor [Sandaracinobacteroides saxicola]|uniref:TonB-dependent receptor n=1 Tax=Sandaracinobacteroides saxicola TaxID=2759707 RepID=A0A7G5IDV0_9SPHN|nr:TonB-dependent receptor [Sandaracinobacteroides saxicola]QMW21542.1 TonB-dependent receptor [Sandaracinobacteroides saxicola]
MRLLVCLMLAGPAVAEEIVVTGRPLPLPPGAGAFSAVTIDDLSVPSGRLDAALRQVAGLALFRRSDSRSANPTSQGVTLRGLGGNAASRALVLLDGVPMNDPFAGWVAWPALSGVADARVTRGGGLLPGALAGTVELFSGTAPARVELAGGSWGSARAAGALSMAVGEGALSLGGGVDRGNGFRLFEGGAVDQATPYAQGMVAARGVVPLGEGEVQVRLAGHEDRRNRGLDGADSRVRGADASVRFVQRSGWGVEAVVHGQLRDFANRTLVADAARQSAAVTLDQVKTPASGWGGSLELRPAEGLRFGGDWRASEGVTQELFRYQQGVPTRFRRAGGRSLTAGVWAEAEGEIAPELRLVAAGRLDHWRLRGGFVEERVLGGASLLESRAVGRDGWQPTGRAGLVWRPAPAWALRAAGYHSWRLPTLNELYRPFRVGAELTEANAALRPERLWGAEAGVRFAPLSTLSLDVTGYWNRLSGPVANVTLAPGLRRRLNLRALRVWGLEAEARAEMGRFEAAVSGAFADARVDGGTVAPGLSGLRPAQTPRWSASGRVGWTGEGAEARALLRHQSALWDDDLNTRRLRPATTLDLDGAVRLTGLMWLTLAVENATDTRVEVATNGALVERGQPRTVWLGVRWGR